MHQSILSLTTHGQGTTEITHLVRDILRDSGLSTGTVNVFCQHTSCSLVLMENADPSARQDLEAYMSRLVPEDEPYFVHTAEGPDDMPSHIKMALTRTSETIPFADGRLLLGTWQGLFLWEHRDARHTRRLVVTVTGE
ncbi:secondary thiamine-phosphate synthase enzyme YjbQ [Algisphaera agarilytica]|uniref:Secondary thiamine-phosphate synthase enzyme n=1 Tax=Algisphaera agarilytica TaxID=1385975 RepID=A0A7X0LL64_9BACT|nr:secondary thiamine-phosphate synthase enzyme YjbQ [Algisphaera agarilytica]MBB6429663.1 secondary thiamine-phosphate synthase enzyme [Algisphaera agarilytica]